MRRAARLEWVLFAVAFAAGCARCAATPTGAARQLAGPAKQPPPPAASSPYEPVPPPVAEAMAQRPTDPCHALSLLRAAYDEAADGGDVRTAAIALHRSGDLTRDCDRAGEGDEAGLFMEAAPAYQRAYALYLLRGDERLAGLAANDLGLDARGTPQDAAWFAEAVRLRRKAGTPQELMKSLNNLGGALLLQDKPADALSALRESVALARQLGEPDAERKAHTNLAASYLLLVQEGKGGSPQLANAYDELVAAQKLLAALGRQEDVCQGLIVDQYEVCAHLLDAGAPEPVP